MSTLEEKHTIVLVHGVGASEPGAMLRRFLGDLEGIPDEIEIDGEKFKRLQPTDHQRIGAAYELYWADLKPLIRGPFSLVAFFFKLVLAISQIGADGWGGASVGANNKSYFGVLLKNLFFGCIFATPVLFFCLLHLYSLSGWLKPAAVLLSLSPTLAVAWALRTCDPSAWVSVFLAPIFALGAVAADVLGLIDVTTARLVATIAGLIQSVAGYLIMLAIVEVIARTFVARFRNGHFRLTYLLVRIATLGLPFALLAGGAGALLWAVNLGIYELLPPNSAAVANYRAWTAAYAAVLPYSLSFMEMAAATATATFGLYISLGLLLFFVLLKVAKRLGKTWALGSFLRRWFLSSFYLFPVLTTVLAAAFAANVYLFPKEQIYVEFPWLLSSAQIFFKWLSPTGGSVVWNEGRPLDVFQIYAASSLRLLGFLPTIVGPARLGVQIAADVIFYILRPSSSLAVGPRARARLRTLVDGISKQNRNPILVIAYSQGSMVAAGALAEKTNHAVQLITIGSPVATLYYRFLGIRENPREIGLTYATWQNFYRKSDFIGGAIEWAGDGNTVVDGNFDQHHMNYLSEPEVLGAVRNELQR